MRQLNYYADRAHFQIELPGCTLGVEFSLPGYFRIWHGSVPDVPPARREGLYLEVQGQAAQLQTILAPP